MELTPPEIVAELDKHIIGQDQAKRAVAIALRNRFRRRQLPKEMRDEILPKNILMIGPTGVGKTEMARRLARLANAPFVKVEATKFTEVGYVGRDVDSIIRALVDAALRMVQAEKMSAVKEQAHGLAEKRLVELLVPEPSKSASLNPIDLFWGLSPQQSPTPPDTENKDDILQRRQQAEKLLALGELEDQIVEVEVEKSQPSFLDMMSGAGGMDDLGINIRDVLGDLLPRRLEKRKLPVREAREILIQEEAAKLLDMEAIKAEAVTLAEEAGIVFIDEIDKIAGGERTGPDVSREGVQRDILPIIEGSTVITKAGPVRTDYILFIAAGAFHVSKPADLIPELQGRFPIRVNLESLTAQEFARILTEPQNSLTQQYAALLATEGVTLNFTENGILAMAKIAENVNRTTENIGARRLHTILERLLEDVSFSGKGAGEEVLVDQAYVELKLSEISEDRDLSRYIL